MRNIMRVKICENCQDDITCKKYDREWGHYSCEAHHVSWGAYGGVWCHNCTIAYYEIMESIFRIKVVKKGKFMKMRRFKYDPVKVDIGRAYFLSKVVK